MSDVKINRVLLDYFVVSFNDKTSGSKVFVPTIVTLNPDSNYFYDRIQKYSIPQEMAETLELEKNIGKYRGMPISIIGSLQSYGGNTRIKVEELKVAEK